MADKKIGTHNSATGEEGVGWRKLLTPFVRCQSKTLVEQYKAGCRFFDIRVRDYNGELYCHHGLWRSKKTAKDLLSELFRVKRPTDTVYIELTWEGDMMMNDQFTKMVQLSTWISSLNPHWDMTVATHRVTCIRVKKNWHAVLTFEAVPYKGDGTGFLGIHGKRRLLPIPWLWAKIRGKVEFNDKEFVLVNFL